MLYSEHFGHCSIWFSSGVCLSTQNFEPNPWEEMVFIIRVKFRRYLSFKIYQLNFSFLLVLQTKNVCQEVICSGVDCYFLKSQYDIQIWRLLEMVSFSVNTVALTRMAVQTYCFELQSCLTSLFKAQILALKKSLTYHIKLNWIYKSIQNQVLTILLFMNIRKMTSVNCKSLNACHSPACSLVKLCGCSKVYA